MWWVDHWLELVAMVAFVGSWTDIRTRIGQATAKIVEQNGRIGRIELELATLRGHVAGVIEERNRHL